jgi:hypothetical protein
MEKKINEPWRSRALYENQAAGDTNHRPSTIVRVNNTLSSALYSSVKKKFSIIYM